MSGIKDIFIFHQKGLEPLGILAKEALEDLMNCFPQYKQYFPVINLGNWHSSDAYVCKNEKTELTPGMSVDWFIQHGREQAIRDKRRGKIDIHKIAEVLSNDISWIVLITKEDLYNSVTKDDSMGTGYFDKVAVLSIKPLLNNLDQLDTTVFQTLVQHEFGHVLGLTSPNRKNVREAKGPHCLCPECIMQQQTDSNLLQNMTSRRLLRKAYGLPPVCPDCIVEGQKRLANLYMEYKRGVNPTIPLRVINPNQGHD